MVIYGHLLSLSHPQASSKTLINFPCLTVEVHEVAYVAPAAICKQRKRGIKSETKDDLLLMGFIKQGTSANSLEAVRTERQKGLFATFKRGEF